MIARTQILFVLALIWAISSYAQTQLGPAPALTQLNLMPMPASVRSNPGRLAVNKSFTVAVKGLPEARLQSGIDRMLRRLEGRTVLELPRRLAGDTASATLLVESGGPGKDVPSLGEDESYSLEVSEKLAVLKAPNTVGVLRGLETFLQLLESDRNGYFIPAVQIQDQPRFRWRGLLIDIGRHYQPMDVLKRNLDAMAAVKLNVLH